MEVPAAHKEHVRGEVVPVDRGVALMLATNRELRDFLDEARGRALDVFGEHLEHITVSVFRDPEEDISASLLDVRLYVSGNREEMRGLLRQFDRTWWLKAIRRAPVPMQVTQEIA